MSESSQQNSVVALAQKLTIKLTVAQGMNEVLDAETLEALKHLRTALTTCEMPGEARPQADQIGAWELWFAGMKLNMGTRTWIQAALNDLKRLYGKT